MFALGCIQALSCHTDRCPTGVATQDPRRWKGLDPEDKAVRVMGFHNNTLHALRELIAAAGLETPGQIGPEHILRRVSATEIRSLSSLYRFLQPGELLDGEARHQVFRDYWADARADSFQAPAHVLSMRMSKSL